MGWIIPVCVLSFLSLLQTSVWASPCVVFDSFSNLYAFGVQGNHSWKVGQLGALGGGTVANFTSVSSENRPNFDGTNTQCYLAQYFNAIYVINGDAAHPNDVHVYDATQDKWSVQKTDVSSGVNPNKLTAILDHDTNVFFALSDGVLYSLKMAETKVANADTLKWGVAGTPNFNTNGYAPLMGLARNHIHFLNVPGSSPGTANIFVIHFSYFQPEVQTYQPRDGKSTFPATAGKVTSIFAASDANKEQQYFAYFPNGGSQTYVIDVHSNTTAILPPPTVADADSHYAAFDWAMVQLTSKGELYYLPFDYTQMVTGATKWTPITSPELTHLDFAAAPSPASKDPASKATASAKASASSSSQRSFSGPASKLIAKFIASCILALWTSIA